MNNLLGNDLSLAESENSDTLSTLARFPIYAIAATTLVLFPHFFFPFVTTRNIFFRLCVEAAFVVLLLRGVRRLRDINIAGDGVLKWFFYYLAGLGVCAVAGFAPSHSLFGDFERMGGVFAWVHLFLLYCVLRALMRDRDWLVFFRLIIIAADFVVVCGLLDLIPFLSNHAKLRLPLEQGSTTGNPGLLAPYLLLASALAIVVLALDSNRSWRKASGFSLVFLLFGIAGSRNRSSELGLIVGVAVACGVFLYLTADRKRHARRIAVAAVSLLTLFAVGAGVLIIRAPKLADRFGGRWKVFVESPVDYSRTIEWKIALQGFRDRPLLGYGPENHQIVQSHHYNPDSYAVGEGVFDRPHNAWLELLDTSGALGTLGMIGIWVAAAGMIARGFRNRSLRPADAAIVSGALAAYATYLTFWFFDVNSAIVWVVLLAFLSSRVNGILDVSATELTKREHPFAWATVVVTLLAAYYHAIIPLKAAHDLSASVEMGSFDRRLAAFERVFNSPAPQRLHTFPLYYRFLHGSAPEVKSSPNPFLKMQFDLAMQRGVAEAGRSIARTPSDDRSHVEAARFLTLAAGYYSDARYARVAKSELLRAIRISPRRPDARVLLANVDLALQDTASAVAQLDSAMSLTGDFFAPFVYASALHLARGNTDSSAKLLTHALHGQFVSASGLVLAVIDSLRARGEAGRAAALSQLYLEKALGPDSAWRGARRPEAPSGFAIQVAEALPILYLRAGDQPRALSSARDLLFFEPSTARAVNEFLSDVRSGRGSRWKSRVSLGQSTSSTVP